MNIDRFSVRSRPYSDESLSSYLLRLSKANGLSLLSLLNSIKTSGGHYIQQNDISLLDFAPKSLIDTNHLAKIVDLPEEQLLRLTFYFALKTFCSGEEVERSRFISGMIRGRTSYCSKCLEENLYFRLIWKIQDIDVCLSHGISLTEKCCSCGSLIKYGSDLNRCFLCGSKLSNIRTDKKRSVKELEHQVWLQQAWNTLLNSTHHYINPSDVAMRILYILNFQQPVFQRENVEENGLPNLASLLQHARNSLSHKRTLHLSFILETLYENNLTMGEFLNMNIPQNFKDSIRQEVVPKYDKYFCIAPWCSSYGNPGSLIKTGTSLKKLTSGEIRYYYLACKRCGCEYAINEAGELTERTYFIEGYDRLKDIILAEKSVKRMAAKSGFTEDKVKRCLAYFKTRNMFSEANTTSNLDSTLINDFIHALQNGQTIKEIQNWNRWENYIHFLLHRFHPDVILALIQLKRPRSSNNDSAINRERVHQVLLQMLKEDIDITISSVSNMVGVCPETLRNWGCNQDIARAKKEQNEKRKQQMKNDLYTSIDHYIEVHKKVSIYTSELYKHLGKQRTVLWRVAPEITSYVTER